MNIQTQCHTECDPDTAQRPAYAFVYRWACDNLAAPNRRLPLSRQAGDTFPSSLKVLLEVSLLTTLHIRAFDYILLLLLIEVCGM